MSLSIYINKRLIIEKDGELFPPGHGPAKRWKMPDGSEATIVARGDAFDWYLVSGRNVRNLTMTPQVAKELGWFLVHWWCVTMWFGLKLWLWNWSLRAIMKQQGKEKRHVVSTNKKARKAS